MLEFGFDNHEMCPKSDVIPHIPQWNLIVVEYFNTKNSRFHTVVSFIISLVPMYSCTQGSLIYATFSRRMDLLLIGAYVDMRRVRTRARYLPRNHESDVAFLLRIPLEDMRFLDYGENLVDKRTVGVLCSWSAM